MVSPLASVDIRSLPHHSGVASEGTNRCRSLLSRFRMLSPVAIPTGAVFTYSSSRLALDLGCSESSIADNVEISGLGRWSQIRLLRPFRFISDGR
jgi:hypothetical protein